MGGMRGVGILRTARTFGFQKGCTCNGTACLLSAAEISACRSMSLSCPRLRPIINNEKINPLGCAREGSSVRCSAHTVSSFRLSGSRFLQENSEHFRDGIVKIAATKVSAGVSTGIGDHESKYSGKEEKDTGDEQFEISDDRSFDAMYHDMEESGLQPVLNDYVYV